jgi:hypothetical protein
VPELLNLILGQAHEEGLFAPSPQPWMGYLFLMADVEKSRNEKQVREPNFAVDEVFQEASYIDRAEILLLRMVRQRLINNGAFILSNETKGLNGEYWQPNEELLFERFVRSLVAHVNGNIEIQEEYQTDGE